MSGADYYHCPICGLKALYDPSDEVGQEIQVLHQECFTKVNAVMDAAQAWRRWRRWFLDNDSMFAPENALAAAVDALGADHSAPGVDHG